MIESVDEPSPHRVEPDCRYFAQCGGCDFWHMDYDEECALKRQRVLDALTRIGGFAVSDLPMHGAPEQTGYRNKVQYPVQQKSGRIAAGFYRARTHEVIPIETCRIQPSCADALRRAVLEWMRTYKISAYDEKSGHGLVRHIYLRKGFASGEALCCVVVNGQSIPHAEALREKILAAVPEMKSIVVSFNETRGNTILGDRLETLYGDGTITDTLCGLTFRLSVRSFYQINHDQAERLYEKALEFAALSGRETVVDVYCGTGTISLYLARHAKQVYGIEIVAPAIENAKKNAEENKCSNAEFICGDAAVELPKLLAGGVRPDVVVVDPPRAGCEQKVLAAIAEVQPERVVYVSCNPASLARDLAFMNEHGYKALVAQPVDMFPMTSHVETVVLLNRMVKPF